MKKSFRRASIILTTLAAILGGNALAHAGSALLEITLKVDAANRAAAAGVYASYKDAFLKTVPGATSKQLLVRDEDVQVLHGFARTEDAQAYLKSDLFNKDVVMALTPLLAAAPDVRIYAAD